MRSLRSESSGELVRTNGAAFRWRGQLGAVALSFLLFSTVTSAIAGSDRAAQPDQVLIERAAKIVDTLELDDVGQTARVRDVVAGHYVNLQKIQADREMAVKAAGEDKQAIKMARAESCVRAREGHHAFLGRLGAELTPAQVDQVKDGLTYGVLPLTYQAYQEMVPTLTDEQKRQILAWLIEAREHAIDGGSSEEKHRWFGKYKGKINNYLSAAGVDLKQAERDMRERQR